MSDCGCEFEASNQAEIKMLWVLLLVNGAMFLVEGSIGLLAQSAGLLADSLDMLADASVYGISLWAVGKANSAKATAATWSGIAQIALGLGVAIEVLRRFFLGSEPISLLMISIGSLALIANIFCLVLLSKHRKGEVHLRASWIFSKNDVIANTGVILSGILVMVLNNRIPDLVIGAIITVVVIRGGINILAEARREKSLS